MRRLFASTQNFSIRSQEVKECEYHRLVNVVSDAGNAEVVKHLRMIFCEDQDTSELVRNFEVALEPLILAVKQAREVK